MTTLMIEEENSIVEELLLQEGDFPSNYVGMAHPDDYQIMEVPITPTVVFHRKAHHNRLLLRISWKLGENRYMPMTFVIDTGAPMYFYLSKQAITGINDRIKQDELQTQYVELILSENKCKKATISETPQNHGRANIMGLLMIVQFGIKITEETTEFINLPDHL